jgi:hypothetical protein
MSDTPDTPLRPVEWIAKRLHGTDSRATRERVRALIRARKLPARHVGRRWMVHIDAIEAYERGADDPAVARHPASRATA